MILVVETTVVRTITYRYNDEGRMSVVDSTEPIATHTIVEMVHEKETTQEVYKKPTCLPVRV